VFAASYAPRIDAVGPNPKRSASSIRMTGVGHVDTDFEEVSRHRISTWAL